MKHLFHSLSVLFLLLNLISCKTDTINLKSPSENLHARIFSTEEGLQLELKRENSTIVRVDLGKFILGNVTLGNHYQILAQRFSSKDEYWKPVYGERNSVRDHYKEVQLDLGLSGFAGKSLQLVCRLYDEGLAFQYIFDESFALGKMLNKELTTFQFDKYCEAWVAERAQARYQKLPLSEIKVAAERPLVIEKSDTSFLAIGEAALVDFARMKLIADTLRQNTLQIDLEGEVNLDQANYQTPWRYVMVANSPAQLLESNYFVLNLNEPNQIENTSWIKPGKVIREVTLTTQGGLACVDFAAEHHLQYVEFDAGWYGSEYDEASDATTITVDPKRSPGPLDLHHIIDYAERKGVGIILYVNRRALEKQLDEILPLYKSWGIKGLKYGFVNVGPQSWTSWLHEAVRKAAKYELMVDIHDEYRPTGYSRTYPNLMTQEGIRGDEETPTTEHSLITAFTRMIAGAGDNTNCYLAPRVEEKMGGKAAQMAKAILLYSPWQFLYWYDRPEASPHKKGGAGASQGIIYPNEKLGFYDSLPTVWDDTQVLEGQIGAFATIARKSGDRWFLGSLVANQDRNVDILLSFLDSDAEYEATIYFQDEAGLENNEFQMETILVTKASHLSRTIPANGGFAVILEKVGE